MTAPATTVVIGLLLAGEAFGQQTSLPKFREVSVEPAKTEEEATRHGKEGFPTSISAGLTGTVRIRNATLRDCIAWAYDLPGYLVFENDQLFPNRYDIDAKTPVGISANRYREMLQSLLADRFHLKAHREVRTTPAYALAVADGGLKLHPVQKTGGKFRSGRETLSGENVSMKDVAGRLAVLTNRPVLDTTSIMGAVTFTLIWRQPQLKQRSPQPDKKQQSQLLHDRFAGTTRVDVNPPKQPCRHAGSGPCRKAYDRKRRGRQIVSTRRSGYLRRSYSLARKCGNPI